MENQQKYLNNEIITGTRPALTMSVPVRYSANLVDDNMNTEMQMESSTIMSQNVMAAAENAAAEAEMRNQWINMPEGGRLGTPDAAVIMKNDLECQQHQPEDNASGYSLNSNSQYQHEHHLQQQQQQQNNFMMNNGENQNLSSSSSGSASASSLSLLSSEELLNKLKEYDALQDKYHTILLLPKESNREVTPGGRDGSAYVLRCLKMWYELPSEVLFTAISLVDRFLDRMSVKPKHMACMSVASFHLAIRQLGLNPIPPEDLVTISQCGCTARDLERMAGVIANKLGVQMDYTPITSLSFLRIFYNLFRNLAAEISENFLNFYQNCIKLEELEMRLEVLLCDVRTTVVSPSTLALVLICLHMDSHIKDSYAKEKHELKILFQYILFLQKFMKIPDTVFTCGFSVVSGILSHYNGQNKQPYKQRLVWKLSSRTLKVLRPTNRFSSDLPTIQEGIANNMDDDSSCRSRSESVSSEEEEDWPTSPIIPIFEQC